MESSKAACSLVRVYSHLKPEILFTILIYSKQISLHKALAILVLTTLFVFYNSAEGYSTARSCHFNRHLRTTNTAVCKFGWEVDACGNKVNESHFKIN